MEAAWVMKRVGGDMTAAVERVGDEFRFGGRMRIDTPLPQGYPEPTPPGAIDLKKYPSVRRAQFTGETNPDLGMNIGFFPLFRHIQKREIAMTTPVEMDYAPAMLATQKPDTAAGGDAVKIEEKAPSWTMSFLYRTPEQGALGQDGRVEVVDTQPVTVLAIGMRGPYGTVQTRTGLAQLEAWLAEHTEWERAGSPRSFYYNGPDMPVTALWAEVQIPIRPRTDPSPTAVTPSAARPGR